MHITQEHPNQIDVIAMLDQLDAYCAALYPAESNHLLDIDTLCQPDVTFLVARDGAGRALGCCALVADAGYGEVKRMFVDPQARGQGVGGALLAEIARRARAAGLASLKLETGIHQPEAIALYQRDGFRYIPPYGSYQPDPLSHFMEKALG